MTDLISKFEEIWGDDPMTLLNGYNYQRELTARLDALKPEDLDIQIFYEMVLWKLNRFPTISTGLLDELKEVGKVQPKQHRDVQSVLDKMLKSPGIRLPMASTILKFLNPAAFQIIDDRVYRIVRIVYPGKAKKYPAKPQKINNGYLTDSSEIYFEYLDDLHKLSSPKLPFEKADRILYQLDIKLGNKIGT